MRGHCEGGAGIDEASVYERLDIVQRGGGDGAERVGGLDMEDKHAVAEGFSLEGVIFSLLLHCGRPMNAHDHGWVEWLWSQALVFALARLFFRALPDSERYSWHNSDVGTV